MPAQPIEILLVEDNPGDVRFVREMVRDAPELSIQHVDRLAAGIEHLNAYKVDVVLLDLGLPDSQGLDTLRAVMAVTPSVPVVVLTGHDDEAVGQAAVREGAQDYLVKGRVVEHALTRAVRYAIERGEAQAKLRHLNLVLRAIRNVNQLIVHEKDPTRLLQEACNLLVETRGYRAVWIAQCGETGAPSLLAQSGWGDDFEPFAARLRRGDLPPCWDQVQAADQGLVVLEPGRACLECSLHATQEHELAVVATLRHGPQLLGVLSVYLVPGASIDDDEISLLSEVAGDLGLALHGIKTDLAHRRGEARQQLAMEVLAALNRANDITMLIGDILHLIKQGTGMEAVAIRLREGDDFPYYVTNGFSDAFVEVERHLCTRDGAGRIVVDSVGQPALECMCGNIIRSRFDPSKPFFTKGGSFWTNCTTELLASTTEEDRLARTRNRCNGEGYESVALIPLRSDSVTIGLLQLNDHRTGMFTLEMIEYFEGLGASVGVALARRRTTEALQDSEARVRTLFDASPDAILVIGPEGRYVEANMVALSRYGYSRDELLAMTPSDLAAPDLAEQAPAREARARQGETQFEWRHRRKDGSEVPVDVITRPFVFEDRLCVLSSVRDISERKHADGEQKKLFAQLIQSQKMESVGRLAGGVAHDFNNLLQAVLSTTQVARLLAPEGRVASSLEEIEAHARRGAALTQQLLLFSRRQPSQRVQLDLSTLVAEESVMLRRLLPENIAMAVETSGEALPLLADAGQLSQVLANLVVNARDAMPDGGRLNLRTRRRNGALLLEVEDTGTGMTPEVKEHLFEPFFSTKRPGQGTGLGLAVVFGIISEHGGRIELDSEPGQGSCFRVVLPAGIEAAASMPRVALEDSVLPGRGERLLLVEDEEGARKSLTELLELLDYHVTSVGSGEEARQLPSEPGFDLLLTDLMLPGITGVDMASALVERWPHLAVVIMSGYTADILDRYQVTSGAVHFLQKPFDLHALTRKLREALDRRP